MLKLNHLGCWYKFTMSTIPFATKIAFKPIENFVLLLIDSLLLKYNM